MARRALFVLLAPALLVGCGSESDDSTVDAEPTTRVVESAYGEVEIPAEPQRIIADLMTVDYLTALGYDTNNVIGVFGLDFHASDEEHYLADELARDDLFDPGFPYEVDLEAVAAADPDLILLPFDQIDGAKGREKLAAIAPLVAVPTSEEDADGGRYGGTASFQDWRGTLRSYGELLDREDEAEAYIAETEAEIEELREEHADLIAGTEVVQAKSTPDYVAINPIETDLAALGSILLGELGFHEPAAVQDAEIDEWGSVDVSQENTTLLDGDLLFLEVREGSDRHEGSPLWGTLDVVQNDRVVTVGNHWQFGGAVGAREVLADIDETLTELAAS
ncbi:ABC transporter substrate-binding protein [Nocardioides sp. SR21]|uniref:ABC transporter substrate-binding protein n=1 Tax=Nocardioides sp. SR21 TaxID=2919501 RepID=UPI001FAB1A27|nr:ABC transporter substrate-binding protein [Nocardioides sp. SR21]